MPRPTESAPCGSKSTSSTRRPCSAKAAPRLIVVVVFPTPPFWLQTATTRAGPWVSSGSGSGNLGTGRPVGPSTPGLTSNVWDAAKAYCTSPVVARRSAMHPPATRTQREARAWALRRQADSPFAEKWSPESPGVRARVDLPELVDGHQSVDLRGGHRGVSEQLLHNPDIGAPVEQVSGERMPQRVR